MEEMKEMKEKNEAFKMLIDMMAEITGDPRMIMVKKEREFHEKTCEIAMNRDITNEQFEKISNLLDQFSQLVDDILKEEK